ncbi:hypothetical protein DFJ43DRAFT_1095715 [Lentinula guzmanii]|uniref:Uncharacterized protein n=1 Tax=Lentinula guzmanii TaxID=2804957 RepID=A0AA38J5M6_9AGAR|nr:hypothetical protein DFJ43DRAFT_1095715 [Lentinula guzmanii]
MGFSFKFTISLFTLQLIAVQGLPAEPRAGIDICGFDGTAPYCPQGLVCCGPLLVINGTTYGSSCVPENSPCPL